MLQEFLRAGLLDIGSDDRQLEVMKKAANDVGKVLEKERGRIVSCVLMTLDPNIAPDDPVVIKVEEAIQKHWATYRNAFRDTPRQIVRAVALEALQTVAKDTHLAAAIRLTGDSFLPYSNLGSARPLIEQFLQEMREQAEAKAVEEWSLPAIHLTKPSPAKAINSSIDSVTVKYQPLNITSLAPRLAAAGGASTYDSKALEDYNQYNAYQSSEAWAGHFAKSAAEGIKQAVDQAQGGSNGEVTKALGELTTQINHQLNQLSQATQRALETAQSVASSMGQQTTAHQLRTNLLWWRQALYSPLLRRGYRELLSQESPGFVAAAMAFDLSQQLPALCPLSVEYWLREAVNAVVGSGSEEKLDLGIALQSIINADLWPKLREASGVKTSSSDSSETRTSLLRLLSGVAGQTQSSETIFDRIGLPASSEVAPTDLAVWLWRDLMAERLLANRLAPVAINA